MGTNAAAEPSVARKTSAGLSLALGGLAVIALLVFPTLALVFGVIAIAAGWFARRHTAAPSSIARAGLVLGVVAVVAFVLAVLLFSSGNGVGLS
jgi:hypothetical protein